MPGLSFKQGEAKTIAFTIQDNLGQSINLTDCTMAFGMRLARAAASLVSKVDNAFNKTAAATGVVKVFLSATDTNQSPGSYIGELKITFPGNPAPIDKSADIAITILQSTVI